MADTERYLLQLSTYLAPGQIRLPPEGHFSFLPNLGIPRENCWGPHISGYIQFSQRPNHGIPLQIVFKLELRFKYTKPPFIHPSTSGKNQIKRREKPWNVPIIPTCVMVIAEKAPLRRKKLFRFD